MTCTIMRSTRCAFSGKSPCTAVMAMLPLRL